MVERRRKIEIDIDDLAFSFIETTQSVDKTLKEGKTAALDAMGEQGENARVMARIACDFFRKAVMESSLLQ